MEIATNLYNYFGFELLTESTTFPQLISYMIEIGLGVWITVFIIRCLFLTISLPQRSLF